MHALRGDNSRVLSVYLLSSVSVTLTAVPFLQKLDKELEEALAKMESEQNAAIGGLDEKVGARKIFAALYFIDQQCCVSCSKCLSCMARSVLLTYVIQPTLPRTCM